MKIIFKNYNGVKIDETYPCMPNSNYEINLSEKTLTYNGDFPVLSSAKFMDGDEFNSITGFCIEYYNACEPNAQLLDFNFDFPNVKGMEEFIKHCRKLTPNWANDSYANYINDTIPTYCIFLMALHFAIC
jgi:hypothetical protein